MGNPAAINELCPNIIRALNYEWSPQKYIPEHISEQIKTIILKLKETGWYHNDIHYGNFVVKDDIVKIIDFDSATRI